MRRTLTAIALAISALAVGGCSAMPVEPWVAPYERQLLADPLMQFARVPAASAYQLHVHQAREGARGAEGGASAGCGCN